MAEKTHEEKPGEANSPRTTLEQIRGNLAAVERGSREGRVDPAGYLRAAVLVEMAGALLAIQDLLEQIWQVRRAGGGAASTVGRANAAVGVSAAGKSSTPGGASGAEKSGASGGASSAGNNSAPGGASSAGKSGASGGARSAGKSSAPVGASSAGKNGSSGGAPANNGAGPTSGRRGGDSGSAAGSPRSDAQGSG